MLLLAGSITNLNVLFRVLSQNHSDSRNWTPAHHPPTVHEDVDTGQA